MNYKVKLYSQFTEELKMHWKNVEKHSQCACFNSLAWVENYISTFKNEKNCSELRIFVIFIKDEPVCILPFEIIKKFKINILQWACDPRSDFNAPVQKNDFLFEKKIFEDVWKKILSMTPKIDVIYLRKQMQILKNNPFISYLKNSKVGVIHQIQLPEKWDNYVNRFLKRKFYADLLRTKRLLKKHGKVKFIVAKNSDEKKLFLNTLFKQKKENLLKNNVNLLDKRDLFFFKNFEEYKSKQYNTQVSALALNGEFIAMHWGIVDKNYFYYLLPSMENKKFKKFSPGKLLLSLLVRWSISKKIKTFDFGLGEESYKEKWSNQSVDIYDYIKLNRLNGIFFYIFLKAKQTLKYIKK